MRVHVSEYIKDPPSSSRYDMYCVPIFISILRMSLPRAYLLSRRFLLLTFDLSLEIAVRNGACHGILLGESHSPVLSKAKRRHYTRLPGVVWASMSCRNTSNKDGWSNALHEVVLRRLTQTRRKYLRTLMIALKESR